MKSKESIIEELQDKIRKYNRSINGIRTAMDIVRKYDGKVINKRFYNAMPGSDEEGLTIWNERRSFVSTYLFCCLYRKVEIGNGNSYNSDDTNISLKLVFKPGSKRLDSERTIFEFEKEIECIRKHIEETTDAIDRFDFYMESARKIKVCIREYEERTNEILRLSINVYDSNIMRF